MSVHERLYTPGNKHNCGIIYIIYIPCSGMPLITVLQASDTVVKLTLQEIKLVDSSGTIYETIADILSLDGNAFAINFIPPDVPFQWQIVGSDEEGNTFSRISDTAIEVSDIDLSLGNITSQDGFHMVMHISIQYNYQLGTCI